MSQVNNAGATQLKIIPDLTSEDLDQMMDLHVKGPFNITQRALPAITKSKGKVVYQYYVSPMKYQFNYFNDNLFVFYL